ncbi:MAG: four helix bundle protein [Candidatus Liptonbacteria bacterium]
MAFRFENLEIWKLAIEYADELYDVASHFPPEEKFALTDQLKRAVVSISNNIAEGSGSATTKNFSSFLDISIKSTLETVNILYFAEKRKYIIESQRQKLYLKAELLIKKIRAFKKTISY